MFGLGMGEIILIAVVALLVIGPDKLPDAARSIGKGIRDLRKQTRDLQDTIENDSDIGGAVRELKSALRGDPEFFRPPPRPQAPKTEASASAALPAAGAAADHDEPLDADAPTSAHADDVDPDVPVLRSAGGTVARGSDPAAEPAEPEPAEPEPEPTGGGRDPKDSAHG